MGTQQAFSPRKAPVVWAVLLLITGAMFLSSFRVGGVLMVDTKRFHVGVWEGGLLLRLFSAEPVTGDVQDVDGGFVLGLGAYRMTHANGHSYSVDCPLWLLLLVFSVSPAREAIRLTRLRRTERRRAAGRCTNCGYDLRGSQGRCPECGAMIATAQNGPAKV